MGKGVEPEYADGTHVILIPTPMTREEEWARVEDALRSMPQGESRKGIYLSAAAAAAGGVFSAGSRPAAVGTDPFGAGGGKDSGGSGLPVPAGDPRCDAGGARYPGSGRVPAKV